MPLWRHRVVYLSVRPYVCPAMNHDMCFAACSWICLTGVYAWNSLSVIRCTKIVLVQFKKKKNKIQENYLAELLFVTGERLDAWNDDDSVSFFVERLFLKNLNY